MKSRSLQTKYMLIILAALFVVQASYFVVLLAVMNIAWKFEPETSPDEQVVERDWHASAKQLSPPYGEETAQLFAQWGEQFPEAVMFRVDQHGRLAEQWQVRSALPEHWTAAQTADFIKQRYGGDPFTVIAFTGGEPDNGFVVLELPRSLFAPALAAAIDRYGPYFLVGTAVLVGLFILVSYLFFRGIRRRLVVLSGAMAIRDADGIPVPTNVYKSDEIGRLEKSFNDMVEQLRISKQREREEEQLRRELIAHLSHDLRTPLTKIRAQVYSVGKEEKLSPAGHQAVSAMESSVASLDRLIDNLMSYTLLSAGKLPLNPEPVDAVRFVREQLATWYPVFEKAGMEVEAELEPFAEKMWQLDPAWFGRILDNVFQNVLRHAREGRYIGLFTCSDEQRDVIVIQDRGGGGEEETGEKGTGLGLSIVDMMVRGLGLAWQFAPGDDGSVVKIIRNKN